MSEEEPVRIPITGELDLHTFAPSEVRDLLDAYLEACVEKGISNIRIIHGKGTGTLRETVHAHLRRSPWIASFRLGDAPTHSITTQVRLYSGVVSKNLGS